MKVSVLARAGWLDFSRSAGGSLRCDANRGTFELSSNLINELPTHAHQLIDARVPGFDLDDEPPGLYAKLRDAGHLRAFENAQGGSYRPGGVEVDTKGSAIGRAGAPTPGLSVVGAATEGCVIGTDALPSTRNRWTANWAERTASELLADSAA